MRFIANVTLSGPHRAAEKLLDRGQNRTRDLRFASPMLYQLNYEGKSVRACDSVVLTFSAFIVH